MRPGIPYDLPTAIQVVEGTTPKWSTLDSAPAASSCAISPLSRCQQPVHFPTRRCHVCKFCSSSRHAHSLRLLSRQPPSLSLMTSSFHLPEQSRSTAYRVTMYYIQVLGLIICVFASCSVDGSKLTKSTRSPRREVQPRTTGNDITPKNVFAALQWRGTNV